MLVHGRIQAYLKSAKRERGEGEQNINPYQEYLPNIILKTSNKLDCNIPELIFTTFEVHYNLNLHDLRSQNGHNKLS